MEMKYLTEQDTGQIYLPRVHITGIVGLDVSGNSFVKTTTVGFTNASIGIIRGTLRFKEYNKVVAAQILMELDYTNTGEDTIHPLLVRGAPFTINVADKVEDEYTFMVFDTVAFDNRDTTAAKVDAAVSYTKGMITVRASLKDRNYYFNDNHNVIETPYEMSISKIVGSAVGYMIGR